MTDNDFLARMLSDGKWHSRDELLAWSQQLRGYGLTVHSRAADLRKRGYTVETRQERTANGRVASFYRITGVLDETAVDHPPAAVSSRTPPNPPSLTGHPHRDEGVLSLFSQVAG